MSDEKVFLEKVSQSYGGQSSVYKLWIKELNLEVFRKHLKGGSLLELGTAWGESTLRYAPLVDRLVSVEGSAYFVEEAQRRVLSPNVEFVQMMFEDIEYSNEFDYVSASYILEHVADVAEILGKCFEALKAGGLLLAIVPNAKAFSRQLAVEMGLMVNEFELTENDHRHGHRRVYDMAHFASDIQSAGFTIVESGGVYIKPFADFQMESLIEQGTIGMEQLHGLARMTKRYPELAGGIYVVAQK